jgi:hypothetical protein
MRPLLVALLAALVLPAPAIAAEELLDTITVPANSSTVIAGKYQLKAGTRYVIEVSGTEDSVNTNGGYGYRYDALYCVSGIGFDHEECEDERRDPHNRTLRASDFQLSSGSLTNDWRLADQFLTTSKPVGGQAAVDYDPNHSYTLGFYPPADGPIKAQTYYAATGGCPNCTNSTTGTFTVKVFGQPATTPPPNPTPTPTPAPGSGPDEPTCASAAAVIAHASQSGLPCGGTCMACKKFGTTSVGKAPDPNKPVDVGGVTIDPDAREILFEAGITDAKSQQLIAALIVQARANRLRDQFWGCLHIGTLAPDPQQYPGDYSAKNPQKLSAMVVACSKLIADEAGKEAASSKPVAIASQAKGCRLLFFPIYTKKDRRSAKRRRQIAKAAQRTLDGGCDSSGSALTFRLKSKRKSMPIYKITNRKLSARLARVAPKGTPTPANAKLYVRWRKP